VYIVNIEREHSMSTTVQTPTDTEIIDLPAFQAAKVEFVTVLRAAYPNLEWNGCRSYVQLMAQSGLPWC